MRCWSKTINNCSVRSVLSQWLSMCDQ